jgi:hypothetical protein
MYFVAKPNTDALNFISAANITDTTQCIAIATLVTDLKNYSIWDKMRAVYPFVGGTAFSHKWNLKDPRDSDAAYRIQFSGSLIHSSTGVSGSSTGYANTFYTPSSQSFNERGHFTYYSRTSGSSSTNQMGANNPSPPSYYELIPNYNGNTRYSINSSVETDVIITNTLGLLHANRVNTTTQQYYQNGVLLKSATAASGSIVSWNVMINAMNNSNIGTNNLSYECAFASLGDGFTTAEASNLYTAVQRFQTTLGRQV